MVAPAAAAALASPQVAFGVAHRDAHATLDQEGNQIDGAGELRGQGHVQDVAVREPACGLAAIRQTDLAWVVGAAMDGAYERTLDVDAQHSSLAGPVRAAQVRQRGPIGLRRRSDDGRDEAGHTETEHPPADPRHVGGRIGEVVAEGAVHLDVDQAGQDPGGRAAEAARLRLVRRLDGRDDSAVDGHPAGSAIFRGQHMAKELDHRVHVTFVCAWKPARRLRRGEAARARPDEHSFPDSPVSENPTRTRPLGRAPAVEEPARYRGPGVFRRRAVIHVHPRTAPVVRPPTIRCWTIRKKARTGRVKRVDAAIVAPQSVPRKVLNDTSHTGRV